MRYPNYSRTDSPPLETGHSRGEIVQFMSKMHQPEYPAYEIKHNSYFTSV